MTQLYDVRMDAARKRLSEALDPQTGPEKSIVKWLHGWDEPTITLIADMVERAADRGHSEGFREGVETFPIHKSSLEELLEKAKPSSNGHESTKTPLPVGAFPDALLDADTDGGESNG